MTREREIAVLMADHCTRREAEKHLKEGTIIYTADDYFEYKAEADAWGDDPEEVEERWNDMSQVLYNGEIFYISYVL